jgi:hypothetical protein
MTVLCCPAGNFRPETRESLRRYAPGAHIIDVTGDDYGYWHAVRDRWHGGHDLVIVEQDIEFDHDELETFRTCPEQWCLFGYHHVGDQPGRRQLLVHNLGFTRFRGVLMETVPAAEIPCTSDGEIHWANLDARLLHSCWRHAYRPHTHGEVAHHHYAERHANA